MLPYQLISSKLYSWLNFLIFLIVLTMRTDLQSNDSVSSIVFSFFMHSFIICFFSSLWRSLGIPCSLGGPWFMNNFVLPISVSLLYHFTYTMTISQIPCYNPQCFPSQTGPQQLLTQHWRGQLTADKRYNFPLNSWSGGAFPWVGEVGTEFVMYNP